MKVILFLNLLFVLCATGSPDTECEVSEMGKLTCNFFTNINSTQTDFSVYFHSDYGHEELLVDCVWVDEELQCLAQKDFECKQPVLHTAEISMPTRFVSRPGTYRCIAGLWQGNIKPCRVAERHQETQQETKEEFLEFEDGNHPEDKEGESFPPSLYVAIGSSLGVIAVAAIILVLLVRSRRQKKKRKLQLEDASPEERESMMPAEHGYSLKKSNSLPTLKIA